MTGELLGYGVAVTYTEPDGTVEHGMLIGALHQKPETAERERAREQAHADIDADLRENTVSFAAVEVRTLPAGVYERLVVEGKITVNTARAGLGLQPFTFPPDAVIGGGYAGRQHDEPLPGNGAPETESGDAS